MIGLRLCGIALEPFWPARNGSSTSRTSVRCRCLISCAKRSSPAPASAIALSSSAWRSRGTTWVETGSAASSSRSSTRCLVVRAERRVGADGAGDRPGRGLGEGTLQTLGVAVRLHREAGELEAERGRLGVDAVGAAHAQRARVLARPLGQRGGQLARARHDHLARAPELERERRVEHVGRGEAEVDPAAGRPGRRGQHVDECRHVVIGDRLALLDRLDREGGAPDRPQLVGEGPSSASAAATSTSRQAVMRASSVQMAPSCGRV